MQIEKAKKKHFEYLERTFGISEERFRKMCEENGKELDELFDELTWKECDAAYELEEKGEYSKDGRCAIELIDIICGPYSDDDEEDEE